MKLKESIDEINKIIKENMSDYNNINNKNEIDIFYDIIENDIYDGLNYCYTLNIVFKKKYIEEDFKKDNHIEIRNIFSDLIDDFNDFIKLLNKNNIYFYDKELLLIDKTRTKSSVIISTKLMIKL